jgi:myo-inositol 2-dehydrogenase/D-chiro-inositol 1-dehydrogenase
MCGFSRRFDASYRDAWTRVVAQSAIGTPAVFHSRTCDKRDHSGFFVRYSAQSGGIFVDCNIHDIDLCLWFFGEDSVPKSAYAVGVTAIAPELADVGDVDNGVGVVEFWGGKVAYFFGSRMMASGQHDMTEIIGTEGKITINANPAKDLVEMHEAGGIRRELVSDYYGRFEQAFVQEGVEWTESVLEDRPVPVRLDGAVKALRIGCALQESFRSGKKIEFNERGERLN